MFSIWLDGRLVVVGETPGAYMAWFARFGDRGLRGGRELPAFLRTTVAVLPYSDWRVERGN